MGWISRRPIRVKAPAAVGILVLLVGVAISTAAYFALRRALHDHAAGRLTTLQAEYRETFRNSLTNSRARIAEAASRPSLADYLRQPRSTNEAAALAAMRAPGPAPEWVLRVELRDASGRMLLSAPGPAAQGTPVETREALDGSTLVALAPTGAPAVAYGKLQRDGSAVLFPIVARIGDPASGYLVVWRRVASSWQASQQVAVNLGRDAAAYMVNADGTLWSEAGKPVATAPDPPVLGRVVEYDRPGRGQVLSVSGPMESTPWAFVFEWPTAVVQAPARTFLRTMVWIAAACILLGMFVAWHLSRRVTQPLRELTRAADAIASGDLSYRAPVSRDDDLGRLVTSFNAMAAEIEVSRSRLETSLVRGEKLALVGQFASQFASGIGQELRNPIGVMRSAIDGLESILPDKTAEVREYLRILNRQGQVSAEVVTGLLDLCRASPPRRSHVAVSTLVGPRLGRCASSGVVIDADIPANLPPVDVDSVHAGHIVDTLLDNSLRAIAGRGIVRVKARRAGAFIGLEISDTGPGVAAGSETRIFEPLFTTRARGTELGLAISKSLAQANGGDLTLVSRPGEVARFVFTLPIAKQADQPEPAASNSRVGSM